MALKLFWRPAAGLLTTLLLLVVVACGAPAAPATPAPATDPVSVPAAGETPQPTPVAEATPTPAPAAAATVPTGTLNAGHRELGAFVGHPQLSASPALFPITASVGEGLVTSYSDKEIVPLLLESWSVSEDKLTWTFNLRQGIQFHKGYGELTAEDLVWSYEQWALSELHPRAGVIKQFWQHPQGNVEIPDPYTVRVHTGEPWSEVPVFDFAGSPRGGGSYIASKRQSDEMGMDAANPVIASTGSWEIVGSQTAQYWRLRAVEDHWRQTPHFAEMVFWEIPEESSRIAGFQTGQLDTMPIAFDSIALVESVPGARLMQVPGEGEMALNFYGQYYVGIGSPEQQAGYDPSLPWVSSDPDPNSQAWREARMVREALSIAIDRDTIIDTLLHGYGEPAVMWDWGGFEHLLEPHMRWEFDPDRAVQLLAEAGYPDGFAITVSPVALRPGEVAVCEAIASMWRDIGLNPREQVIPYSTLRPQLVARNYHGVTCHASFMNMSPVQGWAGYLSRSVHGAVWNRGVEHPWLDEMVAKAQSAADPAERMALELEVGHFMFNNVLGGIGIYNYDALWPVSPRIEEWHDGVKHMDLRIINGYEYIQPRQR